MRKASGEECVSKTPFLLDTYMNELALRVFVVRHGCHPGYWGGAKPVDTSSFYFAVAMGFSMNY